MRDPDGYLIEVGQYTQIALDWFNNHSNLAGDKQQDIRSFLCPAHEAIRPLVGAQSRAAIYAGTSAQ